MVKRHLFYLIFLLLPFTGKAQVNALFSVSDSSGCVPLVVTFTNQSTGSGTLTYTWNFGNGQNSALENPWPINYLSPGVYTVTLTVTNGSQTDTYTAVIRVFADPDPHFTFSGNTQGCLPITLTFHDASQPGSAPLNEWFWEFGDGGTSSLQHPGYSYFTPGTYNVQLTVTDTNGCSASDVVSPVAHVSPIPVIHISASPSSQCVVPASVQFYNNTSGLTPMTYQWDFGDGSGSSLEAPSHTYTQMGVYDISVTVTDPNGCTRDTVFPGMINLTTVTASFSTSTGGFTVCPQQWFTFINTSGNPSSYWTLAPGVNTTLTNPYMMYPFPGTYTVSLVSAPGTACADTATHVVTVQDYQPSIIIDPSSRYACEVPIDFQYTYNGLPASELRWILEDPALLTGQAEYYDTNVLHTYSMESPYSYHVTLFATSSVGCKDTVTVEIFIDPIVAVPLVDQMEGCVPLDVHFYENSYSHEPIVSWEWDFSDGGTSTLQTPDHTFDTLGIFTPSLTVVNDSGCTDTKAIIYMRAGYHHFVRYTICDFTLPTTDSCKFCPMDTIPFTNLTTDTAGNPYGSTDYLYPVIPEQTAWIWFYGPDEFSPNHPIPGYFATTDTGWQYNLSLYVNYMGCLDSVIYDLPVNPDSIRLYVYGPRIRSLDSSMSCNMPLSRTYTADVYNWEYIDWDMGDGTVFSHTYDTAVFYTYADTGEYVVVCTAYNDSVGCYFRDEMIVRITDIKAVILPEYGDTICRYTSLMLSADSSLFNVWNQWSVNNTVVSTTPPISYITYLPPPFLNSGDYPAMLVVHDIYNCYDTAVVTIHVTEPVPSFVIDPSTGCAPLSVQFTNTSTSDLELESVLWDFGDNSPDVTGWSANHTYTSSGTYNVEITVSDTMGCTVVYEIPDAVSTGTVQVGFTSYDTRICLGDTIQLVNLSTGSQLIYEWTLGNGTYSGVRDPEVIYSQPGFYDVGLIIHDALGCSDTLIMDDFFEVQSVDAHFLVAVTDTNCYPFTPSITNMSPDEFFPNCIWNFGDGFIGYTYEPSHTYTVPGEYWLSLHVTTSEGCQDADSLLIHVGGPFALPILSDTMICRGDTVFYSLADTSNIYSINWNFGDGSGSSLPETWHEYNYVPPGNEFLVSLIYCSEPLCCVPALQDTVGVYEVIAGFDVLDEATQTGDTSLCPPALISFPDLSTGATHWAWDLGNGQVSFLPSPSGIVYLNPSPYPQTLTVMQTIANDIGCTDTLFREIIVWGTPPMTLAADTLICLGDSVLLAAGGGTSVEWSPASGISGTNSYVVTAFPDISTEYLVVITDTLGCHNRDSVSVFVQQVPLLFHSSDTTIIIGEIVPLAAVSDQSNTTVTWTPPDALNCTDCPNPFSQPMDQITYTIILQDSLGCFSVYGTVVIDVVEDYTLDLPVVFTPNGDGVNDRVYVRGWGIKQLLEFSIYNRWGERVYFSDDLQEGWDGLFNGKQQNIDTYTYYVKVLTFAGKTMDKKGNITLLR